MRRTRLALLSLAALFTLTGCFTANADLSISPETSARPGAAVAGSDTVSGTMRIALDVEALAANNAGEPVDDAAVAAVLGLPEGQSTSTLRTDASPLPEGVSVEPYASDGLIGRTFTFEAADLDALNAALASWPAAQETTHIDIDRVATAEGYLYRLDGLIDLTRQSGTLASTLLANAPEALQATFDFTFPGQVLNVEGATSQGATVSVAPRLDERTTFTALASPDPATLPTPGSGRLAVLLLGGGGAVALAVLAAALLRRTARRPARSGVHDTAQRPRGTRKAHRATRHAAPSVATDPWEDFQADDGKDDGKDDGDGGPSAPPRAVAAGPVSLFDPFGTAQSSPAPASSAVAAPPRPTTLRARMTQHSPGVTLSPDHRHFWDGIEWQPTEPTEPTGARPAHRPVIEAPPVSWAAERRTDQP